MEDDETILEKRKIATRLISQYIKEIPSRDYAKEYMGEWHMDVNEDEIVFVYATKHFIAKRIYTDYFLGKTHRTTRNFRFLQDFDQLCGLRGEVKIVISSERFLTGIPELLDICAYYGSRYGRWQVIYEQDLEKEQIREKVSRQRPQETKGK